MNRGFQSVTELPGNKATGEQIERLYHRYHFALSYGRDRTILEVACGAGMGLGYLARVAKRVVGGDIDPEILAYAETQYAGRSGIEVKCFNAQALPFPNESFDLVLLYEAVYYLSQPEIFYAEARRVLRPGGRLIICTVNKEWPEFNPSPYSVGYYSAADLRKSLADLFLKVEVFGAFPVLRKSVRGRWVSFLKRTAVRLRLMPRTMKGKEKWKRIFFGRLETIPREIEEKRGSFVPAEPIFQPEIVSGYKIIYVIASLK